MKVDFVKREIKKQGSTKRVRMMRERYFNAIPAIDLSRAWLYTESIKETEKKNLPMIIRRAMAYKHVLENMEVKIYDGELIVGNQTPKMRGGPLFPDLGAKWMEEEMTGEKRRSEYAIGKDRDFVAYKLGNDDRRDLKEIVDFWKDRSLQACADRYETENYRTINESSLVTPNFLPYLEGRFAADFGRVIRKGLRDAINEARERKERLVSGGITDYEAYSKINFWDASVIACKAVIRYAERHAELAERLAGKEKDPQRKKELEKIAEINRHIPGNPARTFYEGVQTQWWIQLCLQIELGAFGLSPGRFDQYMWPLYKKDVIEKKIITKEEAMEILECARIKYTEVQRVAEFSWESLGSGNLFQNMILGGCDENGWDASNELSGLVIDSAIHTQTIQPTLSVRYNDQLDGDFLMKACELIKTGIGMPAIFCDKCGITHLTSYHGASLKDARNYAMGGCTEINFSDCGHGIQSWGFLNMGKILELALYNGVDPVKNIKVFPGNGEVETFEDMKERCKKYIHLCQKEIVSYWNNAMGVRRELVPPVLGSVLLNDCMEKGKSVCEGGARYNTTIPSVISVGMVNLGNSLASIKKNVFEEKKFTLKDLKKACEASFNGCEKIYKFCCDAPKYGNDDPYVDSLVREMYLYYIDDCRAHPNYFNLPSVPSCFSISAHPPFGKACNALPDGRKRGLALADAAVSAFPGTDRNGPTALIRSATNVIDASSTNDVQMNMKFHPMALKGIEGSRKLINLIKTYSDLGGWHVQFNVVDSSMLRDAQIHPEDYQDLIVRVAGYSALWSDLSKPIQDEIIDRTEYEAV